MVIIGAGFIGVPGIVGPVRREIQFSGHAAGYDRLEIEAGNQEERSFLAVYCQDVTPVAVLGMNQPRLFTKWRRSIGNPGRILPLPS